MWFTEIVYKRIRKNNSVINRIRIDLGLWADDVIVLTWLWWSCTHPRPESKYQWCCCIHLDCVQVLVMLLFTWTASKYQWCCCIHLDWVQVPVMLLYSPGLGPSTGDVAVFTWTACKYHWCCCIHLDWVQVPLILLYSPGQRSRVQVLVMWLCSTTICCRLLWPVV
jgi:hypothetical protein